MADSVVSMSLAQTTTRPGRAAPPVKRSHCMYCSKKFHLLRKRLACYLCSDSFCIECIGIWQPKGKKYNEVICKPCIQIHTQPQEKPFDRRRHSNTSASETRRHSRTSETRQGSSEDESTLVKATMALSIDQRPVLKPSKSALVLSPRQLMAVELKKDEEPRHQSLRPPISCRAPVLSWKN
ncbi:hypothetical protein AeNC1_006184 [Aphanomyces euteiches]|nr:hypothetical protein AeNC1_006184 [Aphanomyces euteiches]